MIWQMIKKQLLIFLRRPSQLQLLVGMPILFIGILGFALGGFISGDSTSSIKMDVALIEHGNETEQIEQFIHDAKESGMTSEEVDNIQKNAAQFAPVGLLEKEVFNKMEDVLQVDRINPSQKAKTLTEDDYTVVMEIPEQFTYDTLEHIFMDAKKVRPSIQIYKNEGSRLYTAAFVDILEEFQKQVTLMSFVNAHGMSQDVLNIDTDAIVEEVETTQFGKPVSSIEYYTIGMAMAYVLFVATLTGFWAYYEKKVHVFNRVITGNISRWIYLLGVFLAGTLIAFIHLMVVYGIALLLYGVVLPDILAMLFVTWAVSLAVGGLAAMLAAISYRMDSQVIINLFASFVIYILAFVGGSFFPVGDYSDIIRLIGDATPNGAGMSAYLTIMRGGHIGDVIPLVMSPILFGGIMLLAAFACFPKRGGEI